MATQPTDPLSQAPADGGKAPAPLSGTRSQSMQRLQIGLFGLAAMVLLVGLANVFVKNAQRNEARVVPEAAPTVAATPSAAPVRDPLADAGVVPGDGDPQPATTDAARSDDAAAIGR